MRISKVSHAAVAACLAFACACGAAGCTSGSSSSSASSSASTGAVAAIVEGTEISEDTITNYIQNIRASYGLTDDAQWAQYLVDAGMTPETLRSNILTSQINDELVKKHATEIVDAVDSSVVDLYYDNMRSNFDDDATWEEQLAAAGYTPESYREFIESQLLSQSVESYFRTNAQVSDEDLINTINTYIVYFDGAKRSSHILFDSADEATAKDVLARIKSGELDFAAAAQEYSKDGSASKGGDVGWDTLSNFVTEYQTALDALGEGEVSDLVPSQYGIHIIKCTQVYKAPSSVTSTDEIPADFMSSISSMASSLKASADYDNWMAGLNEKAEITINDIPADVAYNVSLENVTPSNATAATTESAEGSVSAESASASAESASAEAASSSAESASSGSAA